MTGSQLPSLIQQFFTDRLCAQMNASPNTIAGYRDTFRLLLRYASEKTGRPPTKLVIEDLSAELVTDFLSDIENRRGNSARSRNTRLAGIRSFFRFVAISRNPAGRTAGGLAGFRAHRPPMLRYCVRNGSAHSV
jgi:site-specific recombinase XerD